MISGEFMKKNHLDIMQNFAFNSSSVIVIGCSGGSDSMALLSLLLELRNKISLSLICAHVNHNVREESKEEFLFLQNFCEKNNVIFEGMIIEKYSDDNFHNEARNIRYHFFEEVVYKYNASYLVTAHHADDLMETILMRLVRGSTLKGYGGFEKVVEKDGYKIIRPLITYTKKELLDYVVSNNIPYREDSSNHKMCYTRNRYRKEVLPFLKEEDALVHNKFLKFSEMLQDANRYIECQVKKNFSKVYSNKVLDINKLLKLEPFLQNKIIYSILEDIYQDDLILVNDQHVNLILDLCYSKKANSRVYLPNEMVVIKNYYEITFQKRVDELSGYEIELNSLVTLPNGKHIGFVSDEKENSNFICRLDSHECCLPLMVRTRRHGDKMFLKGTLGKKKLKDIFIDKKVKLQERDIWPVVVDSKGNIVWLPGLQKSKFNRSKTESYDIIIKYY